MYLTSQPEPPPDEHGMFVLAQPPKPKFGMVVGTDVYLLDPSVSDCNARFECHPEVVVSGALDLRAPAPWATRLVCPRCGRVFRVDLEYTTTRHGRRLARCVWKERSTKDGEVVYRPPGWMSVSEENVTLFLSGLAGASEPPEPPKTIRVPSRKAGSPAWDPEAGQPGDGALL